MIPHDTIGNILSASRIEEVVGDFVLLKRRGTNLIGLCPFHTEKTPSFTVSPAKGIYKCFGCGKAGNAVNFLMEHEHFTYPEALRHLAKRYNIEIEEEEQTPEKIQEQNEKESLFNLNAFAQKYFSETLFNKEEGKAIGLAYFKERDFREDTIKKFQLGYSLEKWGDFADYAQANGYKAEYLAKTGLGIQKDDRVTDRFRGRVMFPIHSASGRIIGFGGRILTSDKHLAKYINSPESEIYNKSKSLYGIYFAKSAIISKDACFLVEGYTDVISLHQAGIENVVASSGTSLTIEQIRLIQRYTSNITILYDGDPAGIKASMRGIDMIVEQGMNVKIVLFPDGEDPDSFARKNRSADVEAFIAKASVNFILFKTRLLLEETAGDPIKKAGLIKEIVNTISLIPDAISRSLYLKECSGILSVSEQTLLTEINKLLRKKLTQKTQEAGIKEEPDIDLTEPAAPSQFEYDPESSECQEKEVVRLLLLYGNDNILFRKTNEDNEPVDVSIRVADFIVNDLLADEIVFENKICLKIFDEVHAALEQEKIPDKDHYYHHPDIEIATFAIDLGMKPYELSGHWEKNNIFVDLETEKLKERITRALLTFKAKKIEKMILDNAKKLKEIQGNKEAIEEIFFCLSQQIKFEGLRKKIQSGELGRTIIK